VIVHHFLPSTIYGVFACHLTVKIKFTERDLLAYESMKQLYRIQYAAPACKLATPVSTLCSFIV
jgi:hypothetical protein